MKNQIDVVNAGELTPLTLRQFEQLADADAYAIWFENLASAATKRTYKAAIGDFMNFTGVRDTAGFARVTPAHVVAWRDHLRKRGAGAALIRNRLAALSSLYIYLAECQLVRINPIMLVKRPRVNRGQGKSPALADFHARALLEAPEGNSEQALRDRAILSVLLYHGLRRGELCRLTVKAVGQLRDGVPHLSVAGKGGLERFVPLHPVSAAAINAYLAVAGHGDEPDGALFRAIKDTCTGPRTCALQPDRIYNIVRHYSAQIGCQIGAHALRATAATNALAHEADPFKVQDWLGHADPGTTRLYDRRKTRPEDSPTFRVAY